jgi:hypothetical protein
MKMNSFIRGFMVIWGEVFSGDTMWFIGLATAIVFFIGSVLGVVFGITAAFEMLSI